MKKIIYLIFISIFSIGLFVFLSGFVKDYKQKENNFSIQKSENKDKKSINNQNVDNNTNTVGVKTYTIQEVNKHASRNDCWMVIEGRVYNVTEYILSGKHKPVIVEGCGIDATDIFNQQKKHFKKSAKVNSILKKYYIGDLE